MLEHLTLGRKKEALAGVPLVGIGDKCWPRLFIGFADELGRTMGGDRLRYSVRYTSSGIFDPDR
ncbi:MAG TPA: hypothetical protein VJW55_15975 [Candidatus Angelobacter sp.]|nr:hypothetical protein [Candidatus Angelobacter sp.]